MKIEYKPTGGVCSKKMSIEIKDGIIRSVDIEGGCQGNSAGVSRLVEGMKVEDAIAKMLGITCGRKRTSCPDQLAKALGEYSE